MTPPPAVPDDANPYAAPKARVRQPRSRDGERPLASRISRLAAIIIDALAGVVVLVPLMVVLGVSLEGSDYASETADSVPTGLMIVGLVSLAFMILQFVLLWTRSQTLGKIVMRIRIDVHGRDQRAGAMKTILLRGLVVGIISAIPLIGTIFALVNVLFIFGKEQRCLHDYIAGTVVRVAP